MVMMMSASPVAAARAKVASAASSAKLQTRNWMLVLRAVKQVADESAQPQDMPTYQALDKEGLGHLTLALRGRTTIQSRPARRELLPPPAPFA